MNASCSAVLAIAISAGCNAAKLERNNAQAGSSGMAYLGFEIPDEEFWTNPDRTLESTVKKAIDRDFMGLMLDGPRKVDLDHRKGMPLLGLRRAGFEENYLYPHESHGVIAAFSRRRNSVFAAPAWRNKNEGVVDTSPPPEGFPEGSTVSPFEIDVRNRLRDLPWEEDSLTFILFLFDRQSNPVITEWVSRKSPGARIGKMPAGTGPLAIRPAPSPGTGHSFQAGPASPAIPDQEGIVVRMEKSEIQIETGECRIRGAFRLEDEASHGRGGTHEPDRIVPLTFMALGHRIAGPYLFPVHAPAKRSEDGFLEGQFDLNLLKMPEPFGIPQAYALRVLHSRAHSEPIVLTLRKAKPK